MEAAARLTAVVRDLADVTTLDDLTAVVRRAARDLAGADGATFVLRDGEECHYVDEDAIAPLWKGQRFPASSCISGWAMQHRSVAVIPDIYVDDRIPHDAYRPTFVKSLVMVPVRTADPVAAIGVYWATARTPSADEVELLQALADTTAVAIAHLRASEELTDLRARAEELIDANRDLSTFGATLVHDVRSPLGAIISSCALLTGPYGYTLGADALEIIELIETAATNLSDYVTDLLDFAVAEGRALTIETVDTCAIVDAVGQRLGADLRSRNAQLACRTQAPIQGDRVMLGQLVQNLVANALHYVPEGREPVIEVHASTRGRQRLAVFDNGPGIPAGEREAIFAPFARGTTGVGRSGTGLGLALCRKIAERHGGSIRATDSPLGGAGFVVDLPLAVPA